MRTLIKLAILLLIGVLVYNYFFGSPEEKASSEQVFKQVKQVGKSIGDLVKAERQKFREGKYDEAFQKLEDAYEKMKGKADSSGDRYDQQALRDLQKQKVELEEEQKEIISELSKENPDESVLEKSSSFEREVKDLVDETNRLLDKMLRKEKDGRSQ